jgi:hypothetical protein
MKAGDLLEFKTGFLGTIILHDESMGTFKVLMHGNCPLPTNPTWIGVIETQRTAKVIK